MINKLFKQNLSQRGFTLTELIITIIVIGVLSAVLIPRVSDYFGTAMTTKFDVVEAEMMAKIQSYRSKSSVLGNGVASWPDTAYVRTYMWDTDQAGAKLHHSNELLNYTVSNKHRKIYDFRCDDDDTCVTSFCCAEASTAGIKLKGFKKECNWGWLYDETTGDFWANRIEFDDPAPLMACALPF